MALLLLAVACESPLTSLTRVRRLSVRSLSSSPTGPILFSSSRDGTARSWYRPAGNGMDVDGEQPTRDGSGGGWVEGVSFTGQHEGFVNAVQWISGEGEGKWCSLSFDRAARRRKAMRTVSPHTGRRAVAHSDSLADLMIDQQASSSRLDRTSLSTSGLSPPPSLPPRLRSLRATC